MQNIRLAIAEDNHRLLKTVSNILSREKDLHIAVTAVSGRDLLEQLRTTEPSIDVILMDIRMPDMDGIEATIHLRESYPLVKIIAYTQYDLEENIVEMYGHGIKSFVGKHDDIRELVKAIRIVFGGGAYLTDRVFGIIQKVLIGSHRPQCPFDLNEFELNLLKCICLGQSSTEISKTLFKSPRTVEKYRNDLYEKFNVNSKEELIRLSVQWELV